jgi:hypothetical protein
VADDQKPKSFCALLLKLLLDGDEQRYVLLDGKAADEAEHEITIVLRPVAMRGGKGDGVHAACHSITGAAGRSLE